MSILYITARYRLLFRSLILISLFSVPLYSYAAQLPAGFIEEQIATGLNPTTMAIAPDGRVFIVQKDGRISIVENGVLLNDPFLQIPVDNYNERGLSGLTFDPEFEINNYFYVYYTVQGGNFNRISRFTANGNFTLPDSEVVLMDLEPLSGTIHNAGAMQFGTDGKLYVAIGDGANSENGQNLNTTLGKILRINSDGSIPEDNPFYEQLDGNNRAIWAYGFRNPYTFDIEFQTGRLFTNDVGGQLFEEVNAVESGKNYGWDLIEGYLGNQSPPMNYQDPLHAYDHDTGCAVIGATFYDPVQFQFPPQYHGQFFFADYCEGIIWVLDPESGAIQETFATNIERPIALQTAPDGSMYYLERRGIGGGSETDNTSTSNGVLWRISYTGSGAPFISSNPQDILLPVGENASFTVTASGAEPLTFQWQLDGNDIDGANAPTLTISNVQLSDDGNTYQCVVGNNEGSLISDPAVLNVTDNTRPIPVIASPLEGSTYRAGQTISFEGSATDAEDGTLPADQLTWRIDFHHDDHAHPGMAPLSGTFNGSFEIPNIGETDDNVWYRIWVIAEDSEGMTQSVYRDLFPEKVTITLNTIPQGLKLRIDGQTVYSPVTVNSVIGILRTIKAPESQLIGQDLYSFTGWENGATSSIISLLTPDEPQSFTANYESVTIGTGSGLLGAYYNEVEHTFQGDPAFWRIDTIVQFQWDGGSAAPMLLGDDFYSVRWTGFVEPYHSEPYTFYVNSDDGVRLWVNDELIIDQWVPQAPFETSGTINLEAGERYSIKLEYFEDAGGAVCELRWSSLRTPKAIIPKSQLYPTGIPVSNEENYVEPLQISLFPQPASTYASLFLQHPEMNQFEASLYDAQGSLVWKGLINHSNGQSLHRIPVDRLGSALYFLELRNEQGRWVEELMVD
jgi:glucose/arabinose dehydrogenase